MIRFNQINIMGMETNTSISVGVNRKNDWRTHSKSNVGIGTTVGDGNLILNSINVLHDPDYFDANVNSRDYLGNVNQF